MPVREAKKGSWEEDKQEWNLLQKLPPGKAEESTGNERSHRCQEGETSFEAQARSRAKALRQKRGSSRTTRWAAEQNPLHTCTYTHPSFLPSPPESSELNFMLRYSNFSRLFSFSRYTVSNLSLCMISTWELYFLVLHELPQIHFKDFFCTTCHEEKNEIFLFNSLKNRLRKYCRLSKNVLILSLTHS